MYYLDIEDYLSTRLTLLNFCTFNNDMSYSDEKNSQHDNENLESAQKNRKK